MGHSGLAVTASPFHPLPPPGLWEPWVGAKKWLFSVICTVFYHYNPFSFPKTLQGEASGSQPLLSLLVPASFASLWGAGRS